MSRWCGVKSEREYEQDRCLHILEPISNEDAGNVNEPNERPYKYHCIKCGRWLKNRNGILTKEN